MPTSVLLALQTQPLKQSGIDPSVSGLIAAIHYMHDLLVQYRQGSAFMPAGSTEHAQAMHEQKVHDQVVQQAWEYACIASKEVTAPFGA